MIVTVREQAATGSTAFFCKCKITSVKLIPNSKLNIIFVRTPSWSTTIGLKLPKSTTKSTNRSKS